MLSFPLCLVLYLCVNPYYVSSLPSIRIQRLMSPSAVGPIHLVPVIHSHHMVQLNDHFYLGESTKSHDLLAGIRAFLIAPAFAQVPTNTEIKLLRSALDAVYGEKDPAKALPLLSDAISAWETKAPDEQAALYRVRGDCYLDVGNYEAAIKDYTIALDLLNGPGGELADAAEKPTASLGRARAIRCLDTLTKEQYQQAAQDYQLYFRLSSRDDWDTDEEREQDSIGRNPYAAWEWGMALRGAGDFKGAAKIHNRASVAFLDIGDRAHSVISEIDAGIDLAATDDYVPAREVLSDSIKKTTSVEGRDVDLLQRVIAKEGEARVALASIIWGAGDKIAAEDSFYEACARLDQLEADYVARQTTKENDVRVARIPPFSIDAAVGAGDISCSKFKNDRFLGERLKWPVSLQEKADVLTKLKK